MSTSFKKCIDLLKGRLSKYADEAKAFMVAEIAVAAHLQSCVSKLQNTAAALNAKNREWIEWTYSLVGEDKEKEVKIYEELCEKNNFLDIVDMAYDTVEELGAKWQSSELKLEREQNWKGCVDVSLPKLNLPTFGGSPVVWPTSWDAFSAAVGCKNIQKIQKLTYLIGLLRDDAKEAVDGIPITNESYDEVVSILKRRFGDKGLLRRVLYSQLRDFKVSS